MLLYLPFDPNADGPSLLEVGCSSSMDMSVRVSVENRFQNNNR